MVGGTRKETRLQPRFPDRGFHGTDLLDQVTELLSEEKSEKRWYNFIKWDGTVSVPTLIAIVILSWGLIKDYATTAYDAKSAEDAKIPLAVVQNQMTNFGNQLDKLSHSTETFDAALQRFAAAEQQMQDMSEVLSDVKAELSQVEVKLDAQEPTTPLDPPRIIVRQRSR